MQEDSSTSKGDATSERRSHPKRGAFPTPKEVLQRAPQYIPETDPVNPKPASQPDPSTQTDEEQKGQGS